VFASIVAGLMPPGSRKKGCSGVPRVVFAIRAVCVFFFSFLGVLLVAYFTNNQPEIWTRYGLLLFAIGVPIMIWTATTISVLMPHLRRAVAVLTIVACLLQWGLQLRDGIAYARVHRPAALSVVSCGLSFLNGR
jgi:hypothetical protein